MGRGDGVSILNAHGARPAQSAHYVRDYRRFVARLLRRESDRARAMALAVGGGDFEGMGERLLDVALASGLHAGDTIVDVGCGSGRLAAALRRRGPPVAYLGTDVVPELLDHARRHAPDESWRFVAVEGLTIPAADRSADMVVFFSVLTHLSPAESLAYLHEARRVLRAGGVILVSYTAREGLGAGQRLRLALAAAVSHRLLRRSFLSVSTREARVRAWARALDAELDLLGPVLGQSVCRLRPPGAGGSGGPPG